MKKRLALAIIVILFFVPTLVSAQSNFLIKRLDIQLWSEYDTPEMLAMYSIEPGDETVFPAEFKMRIPANAKLNAVAKYGDSDSGMLTMPYDSPIQDGDYKILTLIMDEPTLYRVEYYVPIEKNDSTRNFSLVWESEYDVTSLSLEFLEPPDVKNLSVTPAFSDKSEKDGLIFYTLSGGSVKAGENFTLDISYDKANDNLTVSSMPIEIEGLQEDKESSFSLSSSLPIILLGVGAVLIIGGLLYFFLAGRGQHTSTGSRRRHKNSGEIKYCHECGSRSSGNDKFCRSCGVKLRAK